MKKIFPIAISLMTLSIFACSIAPIDSSIIPQIVPNEYPWEGNPGEPVYFWAEISDPSHVFNYPPYHWEWYFDLKQGTGQDFTIYSPPEGTQDPEWGFYHTFDDCCNYTVTINVTNNQGAKIKWPYMMPFNYNYVLIGYEGDLIVLEPTVLPWPPYGGYYRIEVTIKNIGEETSPAPFYDMFIWDLGQADEQELVPEHYHSQDIGPTLTDTYYINFKAPYKGLHTITICTDTNSNPLLNNMVFEENENNNCFTKEYRFWWLG